MCWNVCFFITVWDRPFVIENYGKVALNWTLENAELFVPFEGEKMG